MLAEIADSFEAVWHERTQIFAEARRLEEQLKQHEAASGARQREEAERAEATRAALLSELGQAQAELAELRAARDQFDGSTEELDRLRAEAERLRAERDKLVAEARTWSALIADERKKLADFLLDALEQVERVSANGAEPSPDLGELHKLQQTLRVGQRPPGLTLGAHDLGNTGETS